MPDKHELTILDNILLYSASLPQPAERRIIARYLLIHQKQQSEKMTRYSYRSLNQHCSLVSHLTYNIRQADWLICFY